MASVLTRKKVLYKFIAERIRKNKNLIAVINGETGSGKTYAAIKMGIDLSNILGTEFIIKRNMAFNFIDLLERMESDPELKKPGTVILFEEVGAFGSGSSAKEWQSKANKFFSSFSQTSRHLRQIFIMTCPLFTNLQADTRKLCHMQFEMQGINYQNKTSALRPFRLQTNNTSGKTYMKYLRYRDPKKNRLKLRKVDMDLPPKNIVEEYEKLKTTFTSKLNREMIEKSKPNLKPLTARQEEWFSFFKQGLDLKQIAEKMGININACRSHRNYIKNKGYLLDYAEKQHKTMGNSSPNLYFRMPNTEKKA